MPVLLILSYKLVKLLSPDVLADRLSEKGEMFSHFVNLFVC